MQENKVIHYCWFGNKPLSKIAKKCLKSWKKNLPDYEIVEWNEKNFDINVCPFVKEAYEKQKWAFVSDYARLYALYNYGGIYFDTDMELLKNIDHMIDKTLFLGYEENEKIAAGVIGVNSKNNKYIKNIIDYYNGLEGFDENNVFKYAIPNILTEQFNKYKKERNKEGIDIFDNNIFVYPEEYCYPINYNYSKKVYTDNTCMVHYYSASWVPKGEKLASTIYRTFGQKKGKWILTKYYFLCNIKDICINKLKFPIYKIKHYREKHYKIAERVKQFEELLKQNIGDYVVISHPNWIGVGNVAKDNFKYNVTLKEVETEKEAEILANTIVKYGYKTIIFNGFANGWEWIAKSMRKINQDIVIKVIWHGSHSLLSEYYDVIAFQTIHTLYKEKVLNEFIFVKESLYEFYKAQGYNASFLMNNIKIIDKDKYLSNENEKDEKIRIGLYASGDRWVKNFYNQLSAISLIKNVVVDCIPLNYNTNFFADAFNIQVTGKSSNIPRDELWKRMAKNDINLYVTFTECAPLLPLESLELGVPCITGNNHHYFKGSELEKYLVVDKADDIMAIYNQIMTVLENKDKVMNLYKEWKKEYDKVADENINRFIS